MLTATSRVRVMEWSTDATEWHQNISLEKALTHLECAKNQNEEFGGGEGRMKRTMDIIFPQYNNQT